jgi:hypothetical protein
MSCHRFGDAKGPDENVGRQVAAKTDADASDQHQTRATALEHTHPTAGADTKLGQAMDEGRLAANLGDFAAFTGMEKLQREESVGGHWQESQRPY